MSVENYDQKTRFSVGQEIFRRSWSKLEPVIVRSVTPKRVVVQERTPSYQPDKGDGWQGMKWHVTGLDLRQLYPTKLKALECERETKILARKAFEDRISELETEIHRLEAEIAEESERAERGGLHGRIEPEGPDA